MSEPATPIAAEVEAFWQAAKSSRQHIAGGAAYRTRCIGNTAETIDLILSSVHKCEKRGTFSLPRLHAKNIGTAPVVGDHVILTDFAGHPRALVTTTKTEALTYRTITAGHTALDGPGVRELAKWQAVHKPYWTRLLAKQGLSFDEDMPVIVEYFQLMHPLNGGPIHARGLSALPDAPAKPDLAALEAFWRHVLAARNDLKLANSFEVRWIGIDAPTTESIFDFITTGTKVATFRLPKQLEARGHAPAQVGDAIVMIAYDGTPRMAIRVTDLEETTFGAIDQRLTGLDGPPVQDVNVWKPLHQKFWSADLARMGLTFSDDMPLVVERFELIYPKG